MPNIVQKNLPDLFFTTSQEELSFAADGLGRIELHDNDQYSQLVDVHSLHDAQIHYLRVKSGGTSEEIDFGSAGTVEHIFNSSEFGILLGVRWQETLYTVWLPFASGQFYFDEHQRIKASSETAPFSYYQSMLLARLQSVENITVSSTPLVHKWEFQPKIHLSVLQPAHTEEMAVIPYVVLKDPDGELFEQFTSLTEAEQRLYRKSNWFFAKTPSDIWNYLINGSLYDPRARKGIDKRFKCQQCAYAWWNYFDFLHKQTEKKIYAILQDEIAYSVLSDMSSTGEWGHGFWSDDMETHARFHLDGLHLLLSQYEKTEQMVWLEAAQRGMDFVFEHLMEQLDDGIWFLHDTIEHSKHHHFQSNIFGKTRGNSLCINTHVQALTVLHRLKINLPDEKIYGERFEKGTQALRTVLDHQPGEPLYRPLMSLILRYKTRRTNSLGGKLLTRVEERLVKTVYWPIRRQFPRLVHPGGFTARDLTFSFVSDWYHITNLKDFLTLYQQEPFPWLHPYIQDGYQFVHNLIDRLGYSNVVSRNPHYIELIDILFLYNQLIEPLPTEEIQAAEKKLFQQTNGYSLDYYASELVRSR